MPPGWTVFTPSRAPHCEASASTVVFATEDAKDKHSPELPKGWTSVAVPGCTNSSSGTTAAILWAVSALVRTKKATQSKRAPNRLEKPWAENQLPDFNHAVI